MTDDVSSYELIAPAEFDGLSEIWRACRVTDSEVKPCIVRIFRPFVAHDPEFIAILRHEFVSSEQPAELFLRLDEFEVSPSPCIVSEEFTGLVLSELFTGADAASVQMPARFAFRIIGGSLKALRARTRLLSENSGKRNGGQHGRLSPASICIGHTGAVRIVSFPSAEDYVRKRYAWLLTSERWRRIRAPEQLSGGQGDVRSDIYSLMAIFTELITGRPLFVATNVAEMLDEIRDFDVSSIEPELAAVSNRLPQIVSRALSLKPGNRYRTLSELAVELGRVVKEEKLGCSADELLDHLLAARSEEAANGTLHGHDAPTRRRARPRNRRAITTDEFSSAELDLDSASEDDGRVEAFPDASSTVPRHRKRQSAEAFVAASEPGSARAQHEPADKLERTRTRPVELLESNIFDEADGSVDALSEMEERRVASSGSSPWIDPEVTSSEDVSHALQDASLIGESPNEPFGTEDTDTEATARVPGHGDSAGQGSGVDAPIGRPSASVETLSSKVKALVDAYPDVAVADAVKLRLGGDAEIAISILIDEVNGLYETCATLELAQCLVEVERAKQAISHLIKLINSGALPTVDRALARYYLGLSYEATGRKRLALAIFVALRKEFGDRFPDLAQRIIRLER